MIHPIGGFCVFYPQEKNKPAARQGWKVTGSTEDFSGALKKGARFFDKNISGNKQKGRLKS